MEGLIVVKQLPIIEENLKKISEEIDKKVELANSLVCTDETVKEVKKTRTEISKQFKDLESQRKEVKEKIMKPYNDFDEIYKKYISDKFKNADITLKTKIDTVENDLKQQKESEVRQYFEELKTKEQIDFVEYSRANINITLSASMKSLKEQAKTFIDKVVDDLKLINSQEHSDEILIEYKKDLNVSKAICEVTERHKQLEQAKIQKEEKKEQELTDKVMLNKIDSCLKAPKVVDNNSEQESGQQEVQSETQRQLLLMAFEYITDDESEIRKIVELLKKCKGQCRQLKKVGDHYE